MQAIGRRIQLLNDNASVHNALDEVLSHVEIARLPKNITAMLRLMAGCYSVDQGGNPKR
ncbi:hypothetical protein L917_07469 [Phytophthora nicotianae]|uniref:Uncharacterized protein n=1 Tax=Phytophthora nicotianae TaxID=4792 RepID=W2NGQ2_PHYNI|nr:hypothetical protein L917_07469 [Phytophthora nicotianae]ETM47827.1 hypothetical protein L914_07551 [Phytophthora nicotianae]